MPPSPTPTRLPRLPSATWSLQNFAGQACAPHPRVPPPCEDKRTIRMEEIEQRVLTALKRQLLTPDAVAAAVDAYRTERRRLSQALARERGALERELGEVVREIGRMVECIKIGIDPKSLKEAIWSGARIEDATVPRRVVPSRTMGQTSHR